MEVTYVILRWKRSRKTITVIYDSLDAALAEVASQGINKWFELVGIWEGVRSEHRRKSGRGSNRLL